MAHMKTREKIDAAQLEELQSNLLKSHACGLGEEVPKDIVKLMVISYRPEESVTLRWELMSK